MSFSQHQTRDGVVLPHILNKAPKATQRDPLSPNVETSLCILSSSNIPPRASFCGRLVVVRTTRQIWAPPLNDIFARSRYEPEHELEAAIAKTGNNIKDVKQVIIGHLHLDHTGGLEHFRKTDVPIWVHERELKSALFSVATKADAGVYLSWYLSLDELNWKTFDDRTIDFAQGITLHHLPGHTDGLIGMQINLENDGTFLFVSDHAHVMENYKPGIPQGWLARDHPAWFNSNQRLQRLEKTTGGLVVPGHDLETVTPLLGRVLT
ncbi:hypothetical protein NDA13_000351 [Ustilago tritici]|nr:hypothetical protein NDA13_000351 [Ustilago tritici]